MVFGNQAKTKSVKESFSIIGLDCAAEVNGAALVRKKLARNNVPSYLNALNPCIIIMKACASAQHWGREIKCLGNQVTLIALICVKLLC